MLLGSVAEELSTPSLDVLALVLIVNNELSEIDVAFVRRFVYFCQVSM